MLAVNWTNVLDELIVGLPAIIAAIAAAYYSSKARDTSMANNMFLRKNNGSTKKAKNGDLKNESAEIPLEK